MFFGKKPPKREEVVLSVHIPKTAGTSFRNILKSVYGSKEVVRFDVNGHLEIKLEQKPYDGKDLPEAHVIHGHFTIERLKKFYDMPESYKLITWVRDPVKRIVSLFYYLEANIKRVLEAGGQDIRVLNRMQRNLIEFARHPGTRNKQSVFLRGMDLEAFDFIGIQEYYADEVRRIGQVLNWKETPEVLHHNPTASKPKEIPQEWLDEIRELNSQDYKLYEQCLKIRENIIQAKTQ